MKKTVSAAVICIVGLLTSAYAQGTFQNLDFEAARLIPIDNDHPWFIATSNALPGWTATYGGSQLTEVPYAAGLVVGVNLEGPSLYAIDGSFSVGLSGGSISQTGLVPADAKSLRFKLAGGGAAPFYTSNLLVSLGGENVPVGILADARGYMLFGADISSFAGQTETLSFSGGSFALDDIEFSPQIVPEPSVFALAGAAVSLLLCWRKRSRWPADSTQAAGEGGGSRRTPSVRSLMPNRT